MKIHQLLLHPYKLPLTQGLPRSGVILQLTSSAGLSGQGDMAPLPNWCQETLEEAVNQIEQTKAKILETDWHEETYLDELKLLNLFPSASFALEAALFSLLSPQPEFSLPISALLMGSLEEIQNQAQESLKKGHTSAKLKVSQLSFGDAQKAILSLKNLFSLRIDVNRAWTNEDSLHFFNQFPLDTFDYVEEPFQTPQDLPNFPHPLAIDESFPHPISLQDLKNLPTLKALVYKPTLQGGLAHCRDLALWCKKQNVSLVLSSSFESDLGLSYIASMSHLLNLPSPPGLGTYAYLTKFLNPKSFHIANGAFHSSA